MARRAESLGQAETPIILGRWQSVRSVGIQSIELKALEGLKSHSLVACEAPSNSCRKPGWFLHWSLVERFRTFGIGWYFTQQ